MPRTAKKIEQQTGTMSVSDCVRIIEQGARGEATKDQVASAKALLQINGGGQVYRRHILEVVHTYKEKPLINIPKIEIPVPATI